uniref:Uncharacterized protein n=1 Tax=Rhizophora mucronata TaxID=61149 RepID=A0A2P2JMX2_RHIMU
MRCVEDCIVFMPPVFGYIAGQYHKCFCHSILFIGLCLFFFF